MVASTKTTSAVHIEANTDTANITRITCCPHRCQVLSNFHLPTSLPTSTLLALPVAHIVVRSSWIARCPHRSQHRHYLLLPTSQLTPTLLALPAAHIAAKSSRIALYPHRSQHQYYSHCLLLTSQQGPLVLISQPMQRHNSHCPLSTSQPPSTLPTIRSQVLSHCPLPTSQPKQGHNSHCPLSTWQSALTLLTSSAAHIAAIANRCPLPTSHPAPILHALLTAHIATSSNITHIACCPNFSQCRHTCIGLYLHRSQHRHYYLHSFPMILNRTLCVLYSIIYSRA